MSAHVLIPHHHHFDSFTSHPPDQCCEHTGSGSSQVTPGEKPDYCHFLNGYIFAREDDQTIDLRPGSVTIDHPLSPSLVYENETSTLGYTAEVFNFSPPVYYFLTDSPLRAPPGIC